MSATEKLGALLRRYHEVGDESAADELVRLTRPRLLRVARRIGSPQDAEDSVQSAYLALARKRGEPFDAPVLGWLITAVVRLAYRRKAIEQRQHELGTRLSTEQQAPATVADASGAELRARIRRDVDRLPAKYRDAIVLHHLEGLTMAEAGRLQGLPEATVRTRVRRGRDLLRGKLRFVWHALLVLPWLLQDSVRPLVGGYVMNKKKAVLASAFLLLLAGAIWSRAGRPSAAPARTERAQRPAGTNAAGAQQAAEPGEQTKQPEQPAARVTGVVVDEAGSPVAGATISALPRNGVAPTARARSGAAGRFSIALAEEAPAHKLWVEAEGHSPELVEPVRDGTDVRVTLDAMSTLSGTVFDPKGNPVAGARLSWMVPGSDIRVYRTATTDADGAYRITGLPSPWGAVTHALSRFVASLKVTAAGFPPLVTLTEVPSARTGRDLRKDLYLGRGVTVRGRVLHGTTGRPLGGVRVVLGSMPRAPLEYRYGDETTGENGSFEMTNVPGDGFHTVLGYGGGSSRKLAVIRAHKEGFAVVTDDVPVARDGDVVEVELRCLPAGVVRGRVVDAEGNPIAGARVAATSLVQHRRSLWDAGGSSAKAKTDQDGRYRVVLPGPGAAKISAHVRGRGSQALDIDVRPGSAVDAPNIVLGDPQPATIVEVLDAGGEPVWGASVWLRPHGGHSVTGREGRARVYPETDGDVRALASSPDSGTCSSEPFVRGTARVRITLDATKTIRGRVLTANDTPARGARVDGAGSSTTTDRLGRFELRQLGSGRHGVTAHFWDRSGSHVMKNADAVAAGTDGLVLKLPPLPDAGDLTVEGRVLDGRTRAPVANFTAILGDGKRFLNAARTPDGRFRIRDVSAGRWSLLVTAPGYSTYSKPGIEVRAGTSVESLEVRLREGMAVAGKASAPEGVDLTGAALSLLRDDGYRAGYVQLAAHGRFRIDGVPAGRYRPMLLHPAGLAATTDAVVVVAPGTTKVKANVRVVAGGWVTATLPAGRLEVRFLDASGREFWKVRAKKLKSVAIKLPVGAYTVQLVREEETVVERTCTIEAGGRATLSFDPG